MILLILQLVQSSYYTSVILFFAIFYLDHLPWFGLGQNGLFLLKITYWTSDVAHFVLMLDVRQGIGPSS